MLASRRTGTVCLRCSIRIQSLINGNASSLRVASRRNLATSSSLTPIRTIRPCKANTRPLNIPRRYLTSTSNLRRAPVSEPPRYDDATVETEDLSYNTSLQPKPNETLPKQPLSLDVVATNARNQFGDVLPEGYLSDEEFKVYVRLFGEPVRILTQSEMLAEAEEENVETLQKEQQGGIWETVEVEKMGESKEYRTEGEVEADVEQAEAEALPTGVTEVPWPGDEYIRTHPYTVSGRFGTSPSTIQFSQATFVEPITDLLHTSKQVAQAAERCFGGPGLPYSPSTPKTSRTMEQKPIALNATQTSMSDMDSDAYLACVMPQTYASITSVLVEVRKRLGSEWLRDLITKEGGPVVLDANSGGAGVLAWREILKAEWATMHEEQKSIFKLKELPAPLGKATVVTGADTLRYRASRLLDNTTFIPRLLEPVLPNQLPSTSPRKQYDLILAPHSLWPIKHDHQRKSRVENLWSLLNPKGGILIILEKGVPRGFEVVAGARDMLLNRHISSPESETFEANVNDPRAADGRFIEKEEGMIIAPCTNHTACPLYKTSGLARGRKDWCYFTQRYIRPSFLQSVLGAKARNHDDVEFSYLAVRRGMDLRKGEAPIVQGKEATDRAFEGYGEKRTRELNQMEELEDENVEDLESSLEIFAERERELAATEPDAVGEPVQEKPEATKTAPKQPPHPLELPRTILNPVKRKGHVLIDVCTPSGTYERWMVKRKCGKQTYRDARKARWGDLWALGAWGKAPRRINVGIVDGAIGKGKNKKRKRIAKEDDDE